MLHIQYKQKLLHTLQVGKCQAKIYELENRLGFDIFLYKEGKIFLKFWLPTEEQALDDAKSELEFWADEKISQFSVAKLRFLYQQFASDRPSGGEISEFLNWLESKK
ncbi:MAG: hypothetical protein KME28_12435 [Pelatocladus maniniholoensis HA4357-MV3]|jgi:hypothetical protein|uniref:Uncharacterized protein n=1 Tax=Pelatocladus maniniholoensis HA4357-MV3 TaxID=1117104 RepID=A0A9E3LTE6_9NOST|nr:hypothetical protein [Pelatocladus maniniholoensis HA4357-MV3]BAZ67205.1 hypothetical protein NIES4106_19590 [Fischerella sp. NIES-4106]